MLYGKHEDNNLKNDHDWYRKKLNIYGVVEFTNQLCLSRQLLILNFICRLCYVYIDLFRLEILFIIYLQLKILVRCSFENSSLECGGSKIVFLETSGLKLKDGWTRKRNSVPDINPWIIHFCYFYITRLDKHLKRKAWQAILQIRRQTFSQNTIFPKGLNGKFAKSLNRLKLFDSRNECLVFGVLLFLCLIRFRLSNYSSQVSLRAEDPCLFFLKRSHCLQHMRDTSFDSSLEFHRRTNHRFTWI